MRYRVNFRTHGKDIAVTDHEYEYKGCKKMKIRMHVLILILLLGLCLAACRSDGSSTGKKTGTPDKGVKKTMKTYYMGWFAIDVPVEMQRQIQTSKFRYADIEEFKIQNNDRSEQARIELWNKRLEEISNMKKPRNISKIIIEERNFPSLGNWSRGVLYYGDYLIPKRQFWTVIVDYGKIEVSLTIAGTNNDKMLSNINNILRSYSVNQNAQDSTKTTFYLKYGSINLPFLEQEETYTRFEGHPLNLKLEVEMSETHEVEEETLAERLAAAIATRFAPGVDVDTIRSGKREAAGLKGEELITRMSADGEDTQLDFTWEYSGKVDSGEHPEIQITMEAPDGNLDEKLKIWGAVMNSFRPMYR